jgi:ATP-dependent RNA helicase HelY
MFVNQADHAPSTARRIRAGLPPIGALTEFENDLWTDIIAELGGPQHSLLDPTAPALPHNGDMIATERRMAESLFRRRDRGKRYRCHAYARSRDEPASRGRHPGRDNAP